MKIKARLDSFELRAIIFTITLQHRRRIETEGKAKVVASVWGANFLNFFAALAVLYLSIWKKQFNSTVSFKSTETKQLAPHASRRIRPFPCLLFQSFFYALQYSRTHVYWRFCLLSSKFAEGFKILTTSWHCVMRFSSYILFIIMLPQPQYSIFGNHESFLCKHWITKYCNAKKFANFIYCEIETQKKMKSPKTVHFFRNFLLKDQCIRLSVVKTFK